MILLLSLFTSAVIIAQSSELEVALQVQSTPRTVTVKDVPIIPSNPTNRTRQKIFSEDITTSSGNPGAVKNVRNNQILGKSQVRNFLSSILRLLEDKCPELNVEKLEHINLFLGSFPSRKDRAGKTSSAFQKMLDSLDRCITTGAGTSTVAPKSSTISAAEGNSTPSSPTAAAVTAEALTLIEDRTTFLEFLQDRFSQQDLFDSEEEIFRQPTVVTRAPSGLKHKLIALKNPIVNWMNNTWTKVKTFFQDVFKPKNKTSDTIKKPTDTPTIVLRRRRSFDIRSLLEQVFNPAGSSDQFRQIIKHILNEIFRIYGHSCPDAFTHLPAFKNGAKSVFRLMTKSPFILSSASAFIDDSFIQDLEECKQFGLADDKQNENI